MAFEKGVIAGNFDVIHPGYVSMFSEINSICSTQYVLLHDDPSVERPQKLKPILSVEERKNILKFFFDNPIFLSYNIEDELYFLLRSIKPDVRFLGKDYLGKRFTGDDLEIQIHWINRDHGWSTTKFKKLISDSIK